MGFQKKVFFFVHIFHLWSFTRVSECGQGRQSWETVQGECRKDNIWKKVSKVVGTEASQTQIRVCWRSQLLSKSKERSHCSLVLHHVQEEKMGGLRRSKVQLRCDPAGVHYGNKLTCVPMGDLARTKSTTLLLQVNQVKPAGSAMERQMGLAVKRVV